MTEKSPATAGSKTIDLKRQLHGTAFLSLEHWSYMALVVLIPVLLLKGFLAALALWTHQTSELGPLTMLLMRSPVALEVMMALGITAALIILAPALFVLHRRTSSEMVKRSGYHDRQAYKIPVYGALVALGILKTIALIVLLGSFLASLTLIGVKGADIGMLYVEQFLPALLAYVVFFATGWYVFKLAKGQDFGKQFAFMAMWISALLAVALFTTAIMSAHSSTSQSGPGVKPMQVNPVPNRPYWLE